MEEVLCEQLLGLEPGLLTPAKGSLQGRTGRAAARVALTSGDRNAQSYSFPGLSPENLPIYFHVMLLLSERQQEGRWADPEPLPWSGMAEG